MRTVLLAVAASVALLTAGCAGTIRPEGAARSVVDLVKQQTGFTPKDVACPEGVDAKQGTTFECTFTGPDGRRYIADMRVEKVEGEDVEFYVQTRPR
ncbi:DUF4333 domain-containing protein [Mycolicibacterium sp. XJ1819]